MLPPSLRDPVKCERAPFRPAALREALKTLALAPLSPTSPAIFLGFPDHFCFVCVANLASLESERGCAWVSVPRYISDTLPQADRTLAVGIYLSRQHYHLALLSVSDSG